MVACERVQGPPPRIVNGRSGIYFLPIETAIFGAQDNHEWSALSGCVTTHGAVPDNRPESRIIAISLRPSVSTEDARFASPVHMQRVCSLMRFHIRTDYATNASDLSWNVDLFFFFPSTPSIRPGTDAQQRQEQRSARYCTASQLTYWFLSAQPSYPTPCP